MRVLIQRVSKANVTVEKQTISSIGKGLLILLGIGHDDGEEQVKFLAEKTANLRIFEDDGGKTNLSVLDVKGEAIVVSQFTLYGDTRKGNRPSYIEAAPPQDAERLYEEFTAYLRTVLGEQRVATGVFRAMMDVELVNNGPVTILLESKNNQSPTTP